MLIFRRSGHQLFIIIFHFRIFAFILFLRTQRHAKLLLSIKVFVMFTFETPNTLFIRESCDCDSKRFPRDFSLRFLRYFCFGSLM